VAAVVVGDEFRSLAQPTDVNIAPRGHGQYESCVREV
jgi:hypothetical protein